MPKEQYMCQLCANHGRFNQPKKGHKQKCPFRECPCPLCALNTKRRALDQIERQLKAVNDSAPSPSTSSPSSAPAAVAEHHPPPSFSPKPSDEELPTALRTLPPSHRKSPIITKNGTYMIALPPTITKKEMKRSLHLRELTTSQKRAKTIEAAIECLQRRKSIFTSAELLAHSP